MDLYSVDDFLEYFTLLSKGKEGCTIVLCAKDSVSIKEQKRYAEAVMALGLKTDFSRRKGLRYPSYRSYIAVIEGGKAVYESLGGSEGSDAAYAGSIYDIKSTVWTEGKGCGDARIGIGGEDHCVNERGLNVVVASRDGSLILDSACFDFHAGEPVCIRKRDYRSINLEKGYAAFREGYQAEELPGLALYRPSYPYGECVVVAGAQAEGRQAGLEGLAEGCGVCFVVGQREFPHP